MFCNSNFLFWILLWIFVCWWGFFCIVFFLQFTVNNDFCYIFYTKDPFILINMGNILLQKKLYIFLCSGILKLLSCQTTSFTFHIIPLSILTVAVQIHDSLPSSSITKHLIETFPGWKRETHFLFLSHIHISWAHVSLHSPLQPYSFQRDLPALFSLVLSLKKC